LFSARLKRRQLSNKDLDMIRDATPALSQGSTQMFRNLRDKGKNRGVIVAQLSSNDCRSLHKGPPHKIRSHATGRGSVCCTLSIVKRCPYQTVRTQRNFGGQEQLRSLRMQRRMWGVTSPFESYERHLRYNQWLVRLHCRPLFILLDCFAVIFRHWYPDISFKYAQED
jgi:hypothetical protein